MVEALTEARARTLLLVGGVRDEDLVRQHSPLMSPLVWDLGHIAHFEELWLVRNIGPDAEARQFGEEFRVLRGGSWATRPGAIRNTVRNWDYPIRRQIFSGFRCAKDA